MEVVPAGNLVTCCDDSLAAIDGTAKAEADRLEGNFGGQLSAGLFDLLPDTGSAAVRIHVQPAERGKARIDAVAHAELELRAANFDAEKHGPRRHSGLVRVMDQRKHVVKRQLLPAL